MIIQKIIKKKEIAGMVLFADRKKNEKKLQNLGLTGFIFLWAYAQKTSGFITFKGVI